MVSGQWKGKNRPYTVALKTKWIKNEVGCSLFTAK